MRTTPNDEKRPPEWGCDECYLLTARAAERAGVVLDGNYLTILCPTHSGRKESSDGDTE